ncbi:MAG: hypothetical protein HYX74_08710 [Acidobacteria bacterium]|nr:hypothetical protein [Acidobacteriota bacterium]
MINSFKCPKCGETNNHTINFYDAGMQTQLTRMKEFEQLEINKVLPVQDFRARDRQCDRCKTVYATAEVPVEIIREYIRMKLAGLGVKPKEG